MRRNVEIEKEHTKKRQKAKKTPVTIKCTKRQSNASFLSSVNGLSLGCQSVCVHWHSQLEMQTGGQKKKKKKGGDSWGASVRK